MSKLGTDIETELGFLQAIEKGEVISQMSLAKRLRISVGLVNALVKRAAKKGYVKARSAPAKRYAYYLTTEGFTQKAKLVSEYIDTSLDFFRNARSQYLSIFTCEKENGLEYFVLYGSGELAEIALLAAFEAQVTIVAIVDKQSLNTHIGGIPRVNDLDDIKDYASIILVEQREPQKAFDELCCNGRKDIVRVPKMLGVQS
ncbi:winged helix-turn-helix transcriptional regulator [Kiloniella majae]|uniref:winged helix-turn-helix transcriptional regulator n=1 Tax=Kiloniella majae TaxID=1938558 RepID=UPI000A2778F4|nr:winged helix-turn-helix transcriptional regulator [Kiloniella majae]